MLSTPRPTPTCIRFAPTVELSCINCNNRMRLILIEPQDRNFNLLTYRCMACGSHESFLKAI